MIIYAKKPEKAQVMQKGQKFPRNTIVKWMMMMHVKYAENIMLCILSKRKLYCFGDSLSKTSISALFLISCVCVCLSKSSVFRSLPPISTTSRQFPPHFHSKQRLRKVCPFFAFFRLFEYFIHFFEVSTDVLSQTLINMQKKSKNMSFWRIFRKKKSSKIASLQLFIIACVCVCVYVCVCNYSHESRNKCTSVFYEGQEMLWRTCHTKHRRLLACGVNNLAENRERCFSEESWVSLCIYTQMCC